MSKNELPRIVILLDNKNRELEYLFKLHKHIKSKFVCEAYIIGSISDISLTLHKVNQIQPHLLIISQVFENSCRQIAKQVKDAGGYVAILPSEVRYSEAYEHLVKSSLDFDNLVSVLFMPGSTLTNLFGKTDINKKKFIITGSPKIDLSFSKKTISRKELLNKYSIPRGSKNIFIFTSFLETDLDYMKNDPLFSNHLSFKSEFNTAVLLTRKIYMNMIHTLAKEFPSYNIIIKPHPLEKTKYDFENRNVYLIEDETIHDCFNSIDLAIHWSSTVAIECWIKNIPTLQFFPKVLKTSTLSDFSYGNPVFYSTDTLIDGVNKYLKKPIEKKYVEFQKKYLLKTFYKTDGNSFERIACCISFLLKNIPTVHYSKISKLSIRIAYIMELLFGVVISRFLIKLIYIKFDFIYSIKNFTNIK